MIFLDSVMLYRRAREPDCIRIECKAEAGAAVSVMHELEMDVKWV